MSVFDYYPWLFVLAAGVFGLLVGSFLNVVIYRLPLIMQQQWQQECAQWASETTITPPNTQASTPRFTLSLPASHCPKCQTPLRFRDNIPVLSWLCLRGRCAHCHSPIAWRYPAIELLSAFYSLAIGLCFGYSLFSMALLGFGYVLIAATFIDIDHFLLPDSLTLPLVWGGIALAWYGASPISLHDAVLGAMLGYLSLWSLYWLFKLATGKEGMGYGDFKLLAALGAWLGWQMLPLVVLLSAVVGLVFALGLLTRQGKGLNQPFPFGPYLTIAGMIALFFGDAIIALYWQWALAGL